MPGVPSGKGCNACRKQKKKCDAADHGTPCSRCNRLNIPCEGSGQQRYKFHDERKKVLQAYRPSSNGKKGVKKLPVVQLPHYNLSNPITQLASAFINKIDPAIDIKYQLVGNFGPYLLDIPRRLGRNPALDAASDAIVIAHTTYCSNGQSTLERELWAKHSQALQVLRETLNDPIKAQSSETLCAIMLLMIVQMLTKNPCGTGATHPQGAAEILKSRGFSGPNDDFERNLLITLRGPVVFEALTTDKIRYSQKEWQLLVETGLEGTNIDNDWLRYLARLPNLVQRGKDTFKSLTALWETNLLELSLEVKSLLEACRNNIKALRNRLEAVERDLLPPIIKKLLHANRLKMLGMSLMTGILFDSIYSQLLGEPIGSSAESTQWSSEILRLAQIAAKYHPLGSSAMIFCLHAAWIGTSDQKMKWELEALSADYENVCVGYRNVLENKAALEATKRRFTLTET